MDTSLVGKQTIAPPHPHTKKIFFPVCYMPPFTLHRPLLTLFNYLSQMFHPITFHLPIICFSAIIFPLSFKLFPSPPRCQLNCDMNSKMVSPPPPPQVLFLYSSFYQKFGNIYWICSHPNLEAYLLVLSKTTWPVGELVLLLAMACCNCSNLRPWTYRTIFSLHIKHSIHSRSGMAIVLQVFLHTIYSVEKNCHLLLKVCRGASLSITHVKYIVINVTLITFRGTPTVKPRSYGASQFTRQEKLH